MVMLQVKLKGATNAATCKYIHVLSNMLDPLGEVKGQKHFFLKVVIFHIKLMGMECRAPCKHKFYPYTRPRPLVGLNMFLLIVVMLHIKLKGIEHINFKTVFP